MRIDISADSFEATQSFSRVLLQQGRPLLDRDWNEQTSIELNHLRMMVRAIYGRHGGPPNGECGFVPFIADNRLKLRKGWYSVDGLILNCDEDTEFKNQTYFSPKEFEGNKTYFLFLEAIERAVTATEHPSLLDSALPGVDISARGQLVWRVNCQESDHVSCIASVKAANEWCLEQQAQQRAPGLVPPRALSEKLKALAKKGGNQLMRAEFHERGVWKASDDNAFPIFEIVGVGDCTVTIRLAALDGWAPSAGDFVELLTNSHARFNEPGDLFEVTGMPSSNPNDIDTIGQMTVPLDRMPDGRWLFARVWKGKVEAQPCAGVAPGDYFQIASRDGELDTARAHLRRPTRVFAPLALIRTDADGTPRDSIQLFQRIIVPQWREIDNELDF